MRSNVIMLLMTAVVMCLGFLSAAQDEADIKQQDAAVKQQDAAVKQQDASVKQQDAAVKQAASQQQNLTSAPVAIFEVDEEVQAVKEDVRDNAQQITEVKATIEDAFAAPWAQWGAMGLIMFLLLYQITVRVPAENRRREDVQKAHDAVMKDRQAAHDLNTKEMRTEFVTAMSMKDGLFGTALKDKDSLFTAAVNTKDGMFVEALKQLRESNDRAIDRLHKV